VVNPKVVLDANVLYPFTLRDTLLRSAEAGLCRVYWSTEILDEAARNLVAAGRMSEPQAERLSAIMGSAFPEAAALKRPPVSLDELLYGLGKTVPGFVGQVQQLLSEVE
jgi:predicted nucleic acid-binding protein